MAESFYDQLLSRGAGAATTSRAHRAEIEQDACQQRALYAQVARLLATRPPPLQFRSRAARLGSAGSSSSSSSSWPGLHPDDRLLSYGLEPLDRFAVSEQQDVKRLEKVVG